MSKRDFGMGSPKMVGLGESQHLNAFTMSSTYQQRLGRRTFYGQDFQDLERFCYRMHVMWWEVKIQI